MVADGGQALDLRGVGQFVGEGGDGLEEVWVGGRDAGGVVEVGDGALGEGGAGGGEVGAGVVLGAAADEDGIEL